MDLSILFATRNRAPQLEETLEHYRALDTRGLQWELIVVDNGSSDGTFELLEKMSAHLPVVRLSVDGVGQNRARNEAMERLSGDLVIFTDDDVLPARDCIRAYMEAAARWPEDAIFGANITPKFPPGTPEWMQVVDFEFSTTAFARYAPAEVEGPVKRHPYGPSFAVRRSAMEGMRFNAQLGPQTGSYAMGGEGDFLRRLATRGYRYIYVPTARVHHVVRPEQVQPEWLFARANKKGRGQVYLPSNRRPPRFYVGGVPLKLLFATLRSGLRFWFGSLLPGKSERRQVERGIVYQLRLGQVQELRAQKRRSSSDAVRMH